MPREISSPIYQIQGPVENILNVSGRRSAEERPTSCCMCEPTETTRSFGTDTPAVTMMWMLA